MKASLCLRTLLSISPVKASAGPSQPSLVLPTLSPAVTPRSSESPTASLTRLLCEPITQVQAALPLASELQSLLNSRVSPAYAVSTLLLSSFDSWKLFLTHPAVGDSLLTFCDSLSVRTAQRFYQELLRKGTMGSFKKVFTASQCAKIIDRTCRSPHHVPWEVVTRAAAFMRQQEFVEPYTLDQFTARCLTSYTPLEVIIDYLYLTWKAQPINFELDSYCRRRLSKEWNNISNRSLMKTLILLLRTHIRGDMLTCLRLLSRIDKPFVQSLRGRDTVICLSLLAKCRSRQIHINSEVFDAAARGCRSMFGKSDSKALFIIGQALGQVNYGGKATFEQLRAKAGEDTEKIDYLTFLEETAEPTIESV